MIFWHIARIVLVLETGEEMTVTFPFQNEMSCGSALQVLVDLARIEHPESWGQCIPTDVPSGISTRPQARP